MKWKKGQLTLPLFISSINQLFYKEVGNGLFIFAPILLVALLGLIFSGNILDQTDLKLKNKQALSVVSLISSSAFLLQLYVISSWGKEIIGGPYGSRMFVSVLPHLMIGLSLILEKYKKYSKLISTIIMSLLLLFINNLLQIIIMLARF